MSTVCYEMWCNRVSHLYVAEGWTNLGWGGVMRSRVLINLMGGLDKTQQCMQKVAFKDVIGTKYSLLHFPKIRRFGIIGRLHNLVACRKQGLVDISKDQIWPYMDTWRSFSPSTMTNTDHTNMLAILFTFTTMTLFVLIPRKPKTHL